MAERDLLLATTTDFKNQVPDFIVDSIALDIASPHEKESYWYFSDATGNLGYLFTIPEVWSAASALATYTVGDGWETEDVLMKDELRHIKGTGKDSFSKIIWNHLVTKWIVGDSFIEVKRLDNRKIANMIPISPERVRLVFNKKDGQMKRYDVWNSKKWVKID